MPQTKKNQHWNENKTIFISWSGDNSKEIALKMKEVLEKHIFPGSNLTCFVSDVDITSGEEWWMRIKKELKACKLGIAIITKENLTAPWLFFESGAVIARDKRIIPVLFNCKLADLDHTPLQTNNMVRFRYEKKFRNMVLSINKVCGELQTNQDALEKLISDGYNWLKNEIAPITKKLQNMDVFNEARVYPKTVKAVNRNTVFVSAPMASIGKDDYQKLYDFIASLTDELKKIGFEDVISPVVDNKNPDKFEGSVAAINKNYPNLKSVESILVIIPKATSFTRTSSIWIDIGYCLALTKNIVVFFEDQLPYMLQDASSYINHVHTHKYEYDATSDKPYESIREIIRNSGMDLFRSTNSGEDAE